MVIGIDAIDLLKSMDPVSKDYREEPGLIMSTIRVPDVKPRDRP